MECIEYDSSGRCERTSGTPGGRPWYKGSQWKILTREFVRYVLKSKPVRPAAAGACLRPVSSPKEGPGNGGASSGDRERLRPGIRMPWGEQEGWQGLTAAQ